MLEAADLTDEFMACGDSPERSRRRAEEARQEYEDLADRHRRLSHWWQSPRVITALAAMPQHELEEMLQGDGEQLVWWLESMDVSIVDRQANDLCRTAPRWLPLVSGATRRHIFGLFVEMSGNTATSAATYLDRLTHHLASDTETGQVLETGVLQARRSLVALTWHPPEDWSQPVSAPVLPEGHDLSGCIDMVRSIHQSVRTCISAERFYREAFMRGSGRFVTFGGDPVFFQKHVGARSLVALQSAEADGHPIFPGVVYAPDTSSLQHLGEDGSLAPYELTERLPLSLKPIRPLGTDQKRASEQDWRRAIAHSLTRSDSSWDDLR